MTGKIFEKYGRQCEFITGGGAEPEEMKAFISPLRYKNKMYLSGTLTEIGYDTLRKFVLICPLEADVTSVDGVTTLLKFGEDSFCVDHCEKVFFGETPLYYWAIVHQNNDWRVPV